MDALLIRFSDRQGHTYQKNLTQDEAVARLTYLDEQERQTQEVAPTDSGGVRFIYNEEAEAIRSVLVDRV